MVEDEELVRDLTSRILTRYGYRVLVAKDGRQALAIFKEQAGKIDLLLADLVIPQMSGQELARRVKKFRPGMKILFMSGHVRGSGTQEGLPGEEELLTKPFSSEELVRKVRKALDGKAAYRDQILLSDTNPPPARITTRPGTFVPGQQVGLGDCGLDIRLLKARLLLQARASSAYRVIRRFSKRYLISS